MLGLRNGPFIISINYISFLLSLGLGLSAKSVFSVTFYVPTITLFSPGLCTYTAILNLLLSQQYCSTFMCREVSLLTLGKPESSLGNQPCLLPQLLKNHIYALKLGKLMVHKLCIFLKKTKIPIVGNPIFPEKLNNLQEQN